MGKYCQGLHLKIYYYKMVSVIEIILRTLSPLFNWSCVFLNGMQFSKSFEIIRMPQQNNKIDILWNL